MTPDSQMIWSGLIQTFPTLLQVGGFFLCFQMIPAILFALGMRRFNLARWFILLAGLGIIFSLYTVSLFEFFLDARLPAPFYFSLVLTGFVIGFALILLSPFSPSIIAFTLRSPKRWLVFGLNVALLCTIVGPLGLLYIAMARPKVVANSQAVSPDGAESAALNTVADAGSAKDATPQSSNHELGTFIDANSTNADTVHQPSEKEPSAELQSKPIAEEQQSTADVSAAQESPSPLVAVEPPAEKLMAPDAAADESDQENATELATQVETPSSQTQTENEPAQDQKQESKDSQLPDRKQQETAPADKAEGDTADQTGETIDIARGEKKLEES